MGLISAVPVAPTRLNKPGGAGDDGGPTESGPAKPQLLPSSIGVSVMLPPGSELPLVERAPSRPARHLSPAPPERARG